MNTAQKLAERLGLPTSLPKHENGGYIGTAKPKKFQLRPQRFIRQPGAPNTTADMALLDAIAKYDTPGADQPKPCNGVGETRRELEKRLNWLRAKAAAAQ